MSGIIVRPRSRILRGHDWVFVSEILKTFGRPEPGAVVPLRDPKDRLLGSAIYNPKSQIIARRFSRQRQALDADFFLRRLRQAVDYRRALGCDLRACRLVWSESDGLPGVVVDAYGDVLVLQTLTLGMDQAKELIVAALVEILGPRSIVERNDASVRALEGMPPVTGVLHGPEPGEVEITVPAGLVLAVDPLRGQKTGLYLDQLANHTAVARHAVGKRVLDVFTHAGGFALACAKAGAISVLAVDSSAEALAQAKRNAERNGLADRVEWRAQDAFDFLAGEEKRGAQYDLIVLDPPSFTQAKGATRDAMRGYKDLHLRALALLVPGGRLASFTCSHHVSATDFRTMVSEASTDAKRALRILETYRQPFDHPVLLALPETEYLRGWLFELVPGR